MRPWGLAVSLICALSVAGRAQPDVAGSVSYRADTTLVLIPVSVTDAANRYVLGLEKDNFRLLEDGAGQTIKYFSNEDTPLSVGLLVDTSGSMAASSTHRGKPRKNSSRLSILPTKHSWWSSAMRLT